MSRKIRIECEQRNRAGGVLIDLRTGAQAFFNRGEDIRIELALFAAGRMLQKTDLSNIKVTFKDANGTAIITETIISPTNMSASLTAQQWRQGTGALTVLLVAAESTGVLPAGMITLEVKGTVAGETSIFASGTIETVTVAGLTTGTAPTPSPPTAYTKAEADALFEPAGAAAGLSDDIVALRNFVGSDGDDVDGQFLRAVPQEFTDDEQAILRSNANAVIYNGSQTLSGTPSVHNPDTQVNDNWQCQPDGREGFLTIMEVDSNSFYEIRQPLSLPAGQPHLLTLQQGYKAKWTSHYTFPPNEITYGAGTGDFAKESWHPATGEGVDRFQLVYDGATTHVQRFRQTAMPQASIDFIAESPYWTGSGWNDASSLIGATAAGTPTTSAMAGSSFTGVTFDATTNALNFTMGAVTVARGFALAMVFTATNSSSQRVLFSSNSMGIQVVADSDGMRLQAFGGAALSGLLIATSYSAKPVAFVAVVRPGSAGAYVLTTDPTGGGQTGSFTPTTPASGYGRWGSESGGWVKGLACVIARTRIFRSGLNPDQARAVLDGLTSYYQIG